MNPATLLVDASQSPEVLRELWPAMSGPERVESFKDLSAGDAQEFFLSLSASDQADLIHALPEGKQRLWVRLLAPDDAADLIQEADPEDRPGLMALFDDVTRKEVSALLAYAEDDAGGLMNPRYARLRPDMTVDEAISYLRRQAVAHVEKLYYAYVLAPDQTLVGVVSVRELLAAPGKSRVSDIMARDVVTVRDDADQETIPEAIATHDLAAIPVVDAEGRMVGVITVDDVVDVVTQETTEDIHKLGGMEAIDTPYLQATLGEMLAKRAPWLAVLFLGEMLTASAMTHYEGEIGKAVVLATFIPLIISSGGNSGSQASTLVIRAMTLGQVRGRNWYRVLRRELGVGLLLGGLLAAIGFARIEIWQQLFGTYGPHSARLAAAVGVSLLGVVAWGTVTGSMLPLGLRKLGLDPASASAPLVATLVDVTGLVIFFSVASRILAGTLL